MVNGCQNNDLNELYLYFSTGKDLSSYVWENYNFYDLWNAVENGATPPERNPCNSSYIASVRSCTLAVLGNFTTINDFVGFNRDFYNLYLLIIGQEPILIPSFDSDCVARLYSVFSIGLTGKWRQPQDLTAVLSKSAALAFVQYQQTQSFNALISKSAALDAVQFLQDQQFNVDLVSYAYLLDDYPNAAAAYSVRLLSSTYSGALVRIRKDTGGQPEKDFYADSNNELSLSSEDGLGTSLNTWIGANDGFVVTWYDQSGVTVRNATQSSASSQPKIISAGALITTNGKAILDFNGNKNIPIPNASTTTTDLSAVLVRNIVTYPSTYKTAFNYKRWGLTYNSNGDASFGNGAHLFKDATTSKSDDYPTTTGQAVDFIYNKDNLERNGTATTLSSGAGYGVGAASIGSYSGTTQAFGEKIQELVIYETDENANKSGLVSNVNSFYSIY